MSFTVIPLHNLDLPADTRIAFGTEFNLEPVPAWLKKDENWLNNLSRHDRQSVLDARFALVSEYQATSIGEPDPEWKGQKPRGIQELRFQTAILANFCMWAVQPSTVCFTNGFHALNTIDGITHDPPVLLRSEREGSLYCHPRDLGNPFEIRHAKRAAALFEKISQVPRKNLVWAALRASWAALASYIADRRYPLFWQALESLFTSETKRHKVTERLINRISYFVAENSTDHKKISSMVENCYDTRSTIIHGRWEDGPEIDDRMADTESIVRTVIRKIADTPGMLGAFLSPKRDDFLDAWVQSKAFTPPTFP